MKWTLFQTNNQPRIHLTVSRDNQRHVYCILLHKLHRHIQPRCQQRANICSAHIRLIYYLFIGHMSYCLFFMFLCIIPKREWETERKRKPLKTISSVNVYPLQFHCDILLFALFSIWDFCFPLTHKIQTIQIPIQPPFYH